MVKRLQIKRTHVQKCSENKKKKKNCHYFTVYHLPPNWGLDVSLKDNSICRVGGQTHPAINGCPALPAAPQLSISHKQRA